MRDETYTPFAGKMATRRATSARVLHRFHKPGHVAEIAERRVTQFAALEFVVTIDGALQESQLFHGGRLDEYPTELAARVRQFEGGGWVEDPTARPAVS